MVIGEAMFGQFRRKSTNSERGARISPDKLVAEAETMLAGRLALSPLVNKYGTGWACINTLAHADWDALAVIANGARVGGGRAWESALVFLADELMSTACDPAGLLQVQRKHLIPLELDLLRSGGPLTASKLVDLVRPELARARDPRRGNAGLPPVR
jgi:hypothetical protein